MVNKVETIKIGTEIDKKLYTEFARIAQESGQSQRYLLEKAMRHYIEFIAPFTKHGSPRSDESLPPIHRQESRTPPTTRAAVNGGALSHACRSN